MKTATTRALSAASLSAALLVGAGSTAAAEFIDYWGDNLFGGIAYHRFGCYDDDQVTLSNQDYDGFTDNRYCFAGEPWDAPADAGYAFLDWNYTSGKAELDACGESTNDIYGTHDYAPQSSTCSYNIFTDCNSDCWIREFSSCQGWEIDVLSPCW